MNPLSIIGGLIFLLTIICVFLSGSEFVQKYLGIIVSIAGSSFIILPIATGMIAFGLFPNPIVTIAIVIGMAIFINFIIPSGWL